MTDVVAALIFDGDRFLACQRPAHKARGLLWEFVGGKVEAGETKQEALIRECKEELDITIAVGDVFMELTHVYPDLTVHLTLYLASIISGVPRRLEHQDIRWITTSEIDHFDFCPADMEILAALKRCSGVLQARLFALQDLSYKRFQCKLMPTVPSEKVIGVRMPALRKLSKQLTAEEVQQLMGSLPHDYYEEDNLQGILINEITDYRAAVDALDVFLPHIDNWATCDLLSPKAFSGRPAALLTQISRWLASNHTYTVRFAVGVLMKFYLNDGFSPEYLEWVASVDSKEYYVNMMVAWYFATALAAQYDSTVGWIEQGRLPVWIHNKTIQKAVESFRISPEKKQYLSSLRHKEVKK